MEDANVLIYIGLYMLTMVYTTVFVLGSATAAFLLLKGWLEREALRSELQEALGRCRAMRIKVEELWLETARLRIDKGEAVAVLEQQLRKLHKEKRRLRARFKRRGRLLDVAAAEHIRLMRERNEFRSRLALLQAEGNWKRTALEYESAPHLAVTGDPDSCDEDWERLEAARTAKDSVEGVVIGISRDGLFIDVGVPAFLPAALLDINYPTELDEFRWQVLECRVVNVDRRRRRVLLSRCGILLKERKERCEQATARYRRGEIVDGKVVGVSRRGIWVEVSPGITGVVPLPLDNGSNARSTHPVLEAGDAVRVRTVAVQRPPFTLALALV